MTQPRPENDEGQPEDGHAAAKAESVADAPEQDSPNRRKSPKQGRRRILGSASLTGVALLVMTAIAMGAVGYIIGSSGGKQPAGPAQPAARAVQPPASSQALPVLPPVAPTTPAATEERPAAYDFSATTMAGESFQIDQTRGSPTLLVFWSHW